MVKNKRRCIVIIVGGIMAAALLCITICYYRKPNNSVHGDDLAIYENELQKLNEEFDAYIREAYEKEIEFNKRVGEGVAIPVND